ncbi:MAG: general secretion pathway protein GspK [Planctomycetota bacterium]|nr:MAG: general secretion pathway protein GspK [Planctomycetota bacterium]
MRVTNETKNNVGTRAHRGIVLLVTLVLLVVLSMLGYTLSVRLASRRHRDHYIIDYQAARYGCDSAMKYALAILEEIEDLKLIARSNEPDFSDLFYYSESEYNEYLADWAAKRTFDEDINLPDTNDINDVNDFNDVDILESALGVIDVNEPNSSTVRGPYGPSWPFVVEPVELKIGSATVKIEIEDENAKYPLGWAMLEEGEVKREAEAALETFCEWMGMGSREIDLLKRQLEQMSEIKPFKLDFKPIKKKAPIDTSARRSRRGRRSGRTARYKTTTVSAAQQIARQRADFAKLFHGSIIDTESLARPTIVSESRKESTLKYMGMWASRQVNINTAPRHVLEAAFTFGGDAGRIAEVIIQRRRITPFKDIDDLRKSVFRYSSSIEKCEKYITTVSRFFTIRVTAISGVAKASAIIAVTKDGGKIERIGIISS